MNKFDLSEIRMCNCNSNGPLYTNEEITELHRLKQQMQSAYYAMKEISRNSTMRWINKLPTVNVQLDGEERKIHVSE